MTFCLYDTLRGIMNGDKEQFWLNFESFHSEQPRGKHKSISPKAAKKPFLHIRSWSRAYKEIILLIYILETYSVLILSYRMS